MRGPISVTHQYTGKFRESFSIFVRVTYCTVLITELLMANTGDTAQTAIIISDADDDDETSDMPPPPSRLPPPDSYEYQMDDDTRERTRLMDGESRGRVGSLWTTFNDIHDAIYDVKGKINAEAYVLILNKLAEHRAQLTHISNYTGRLLDGLLQLDHSNNELRDENAAFRQRWLVLRRVNARLVEKISSQNI